MKVTNKNRTTAPKLTVVEPTRVEKKVEPVAETEPRRDNRVHVPRVQNQTLNPGHFKYLAAAVATAIALLLFI